MAVDKFIKAQALLIITENYPALDKAIEDIKREVDGARVEGDTAFTYAKEQLRRQGIKEGLDLLRQRLVKYAEQ